ncbi:hypothetical protein ABEI33_09085 [Pantoea agglomerans]|uniref:hypothetical protein n=1 Tax=Enterobacter agglomerans TaxID=549 RepID=UPI001654AB93|nr:hypothetical protein [Pantoea agglomerans]
MKILIATSRFKDLAGSEITVFEYAEEFKRQGNEVYIASFEKTSLLEKECESAGVSVSTFYDEILINTVWDVIWVLHAPAYYALFARLDYQAKKVVFSSLSHFEPLESPPVEVREIDCFTANSVENERFFCEKFPGYSARVSVLPNSIPDSFWAVEPTEIEDNKLIIVSNHLPDEVLQLAERLRNNKWHVDIFGVGYLHRKVSANDMVNYRACISIGKTVQYALGLKIPVFCYDRFGGPGWITPENVELAAEYNFSGRCSNLKKSAEELEACFINDAIPDTITLQYLFNYAKSNFSLSINLSKVLSSIDASNESTILPNVTLKNILAKHLDVFLRDQKRQLEFQDAWITESQRRSNVEAQLLEVHEAWQIEKKRSHDYPNIEELKAVNANLKEQIVQQNNIIEVYASKLEKYSKYIIFAKKIRSSKKLYRISKIAKRFIVLIHKVKK